jgi:FOG: PKD repeat
MADTHGFEVVLEAREAVLKKALRGAWKSAKCAVDPGDQGRIPENVPISPTSLGAWSVSEGHATIPQDQLDAKMDTAIHGAEIKLGLIIQLQIKDPIVPSAGLIDITADVKARVPVGLAPGTKNVVLVLDNLPLDNVTATLTSGDPVATRLDTFLKEFLDKSYENGKPGTTPDPRYPTIPHSKSESNVTWSLGPFGSLTVDVYSEIYDDNADPVRHITTLRTGSPPAETLQISLPIYLRIFHFRPTGAVASLGLVDPMGIETQLLIKCPLDSPPGSYTIHFDTAVVDTSMIAPAPGVEGTNYTTNKGKIPILNLDDLLKMELTTRGQQMVDQLPNTSVFQVPTIAQIESEIKRIFHQELEARDFVGIWTPEGAGAVLPVADVTPQALSDSLAIAINSSAGADATALSTFVPADREFAVAISGGRVQQIIDKTRVDNHFANADLPKRMKSGDDDVDLKTLNVFLVPNAIRMTGKVTVIDAILGSIDVDADFRVDVGLHWVPDAALNADGGQLMDEDILDKDVDPEESVLLWVITAILAVLTFGAGSVLGAVIIVVIGIIINAIVENIGGEKLVDGVTGALKGITAWPPKLARIGRVTAVFHNPVGIDTSGLLMSGTLEVVSSCEAVQILTARTANNYSVSAAAALNLMALNTGAVAAYRWLPGDGTPEIATQNVLHTYVASGVYVARHTLTITEAGGDTNRRYALVNVANVVPVVDAGPDITVNEGEVVVLVGHFTDVEYPDTHESSWNFGDDQPPKPGVIVETNTPPHAEGTSTVEHAWCDNGEYIVTLRVRDQNGGMTTDTRRVTVLNVPPVVDAGPDMYAYRCSVITLTGKFTDPGWCDTHTGTWGFGDCSPPQTATIREKHEPPAGTGVVIASHCYERCGTYHVVCTVVDDDGGVGSDATVIEVVDVENGHFEGGYRQSREGTVANGWKPYVLPNTSTSIGVNSESVFSCEECVVRDGQRSQRIRVTNGQRAGIYQKVGANPGWDYQITAWYTIAARASGTTRLGIDPLGGTAPDASSVVWMAGSESPDWAQLAIRAVAGAKASRITIFLEAAAGTSDAGTAGLADVCFDDVRLVPVQPFCPDEKPPQPKPEETCVDFTDLHPDSEFPSGTVLKGFRFTMLDGKPSRIVSYGPPPGISKLQLGRGVIVDLPFAADWVRVRLAPMERLPIEVVAIDSDGKVLQTAATIPGGPGEQQLVLNAAGIVRVQITTKGFEATLIEICAGRKLGEQG